MPMVESVFCKNQVLPVCIRIDVRVSSHASHIFPYIFITIGQVGSVVTCCHIFQLHIFQCIHFLRKHRCALESKISFIGYAELVLTATPFGSHQNDTIGST